MRARSGLSSASRTLTLEFRVSAFAFFFLSYKLLELFVEYYFGVFALYMKVPVNIFNISQSLWIRHCALLFFFCILSNV